MSFRNTMNGRIMAGVPALNAALYRRIRFLVGDPVALIEVSDAEGKSSSTLILRDIEMERAKRNARVDQVACPADYSPTGGLSGDRETATAQAAAECLRRHGVQAVEADRSLPMIYVHYLGQAGITVNCNTDWGVTERRQKDEQELQLIEHAQAVTEIVMKQACETIANAERRQNGALFFEGHPLTSERVRSMIDGWLLQHAFSNPESIVAGGPIGADCHDHGHGPLYADQPIIVDIFPRDKKTLYNGDCTRTVVNGVVSDRVKQMHQAVVAAKKAATATVRPGITGQAVHEATSKAMQELGFAMKLPGPNDDDQYTAMTHGTGHGLGLEVHEPPLLAAGGPPLLIGDVLTIEPGLYCRAIGGVRVEDMVFVTDNGCRNVNKLHEGLDWRT